MTGEGELEMRTLLAGIAVSAAALGGIVCGTPVAEALPCDGGPNGPAGYPLLNTGEPACRTCLWDNQNAPSGGMSQCYSYYVHGAPGQGPGTACQQSGTCGRGYRTAPTDYRTFVNCTLTQVRIDADHCKDVPQQIAPAGDPNNCDSHFYNSCPPCQDPRGLPIGPTGAAQQPVLPCDHSAN
jgi:hypothetical protein